MPTMLSSPVAITTSGFTTSAWNTVSLSGDVAAGSTGAIFIFTFTTGKSGLVAFRMTGSTDTWGQTISSLSAAQQTTHTGLNGSYECDIYVTTTNGLSIYLVGYWGTEATFNTNAVSLGSISDSTFTTVNASSDIPGGTLGVIFGCSANGGGNWFRQNGGSDDFHTSSGALVAPFGIVGVDGNGEFQGKFAGSVQTCYLMGYITSGLSWGTNSTDVTPTSTGVQNVANPPNAATTIIYNVLGTAAATVCSSGVSGLPNIECAIGAGGQMLTGVNPTVNFASLSSMLLKQLGYFAPTTPPVPPTTLYGLQPMLGQ